MPPVSEVSEVSGRLLLSTDLSLLRHFLTELRN
jgi:hypothetical protein